MILRDDSFIFSYDSCFTEGIKGVNVCQLCCPKFLCPSAMFVFRLRSRCSKFTMGIKDIYVRNVSVAAGGCLAIRCVYSPSTVLLFVGQLSQARLGEGRVSRSWSTFHYFPRGQDIRATITPRGLGCTDHMNHALTFTASTSPISLNPSLPTCLATFLIA